MSFVGPGLLWAPVADTATGIAVLLQRQNSNAWTTTPSQACSKSEIIWLARALCGLLRCDGPRAWLLVHRDVPRQGFKNITLTKNTVTQGGQLQVRLATSPRSFDWHVTVPRPGPPPVCCQCTCRGKVSNLKPQLFSNFKFNIRDSTSKLETIGINLPVNLNLNLLRWTCFADSTAAWAAARRPRRRGSDYQYRVVSTARASWVMQRAKLPQASRYAAAVQTRTASVQVQVGLPLDLNCPQGKLTEVRAMLILAFTAPALAFTGPVLVKANKSYESPDWILIFF